MHLFKRQITTLKFRHSGYSSHKLTLRRFTLALLPSQTMYSYKLSHCLLEVFLIVDVIIIIKNNKDSSYLFCAGHLASVLLNFIDVVNLKSIA